MTRDDPDPDRHLWVVAQPEEYTRMTAEQLRSEIERLKRRNDEGWARAQQRLTRSPR